MTVVARVRRGRRFAVRLLGCVLLSAAVTGVGEAALAAHLADRSVLREGLVMAGGDAAAVQQLSAAADDPWTGARTALDSLAARPDVLAVRLLDPDGTVRVAVPAGTGQAAAGTQLPERTVREQVRRALASGTAQPVGDPGSDRLSVVVPTRVDGDLRALQLVVDAGPAAERAASLRRALLALLGAGALATGPLALAFGGRRLIQRHREVLEAADVDDLTGIGNRRAFRRALTEAVESALDLGTPFSLLVVEVHGLGEVNQTTGRRRGDGLVAAAATTLVAGRPADTVFRTGGDSFAVLLPGVAEQEAEQLAGRLAARIAVEVPPLTARTGTCVLDERCPDAEMLLIGADAALGTARSTPPVRVGAPAGVDDLWDIRELTDPTG
jgi:diguanylate cyclase (GGDEF)-like protein